MLVTIINQNSTVKPPNYSSIASKFNEPSDSKYVVTTLNEAAAADPRYNTPNMVIFVKSEKAYYHLNDGASGTSVSDWTKMAGDSSVFKQYVSSKSYVIGETAAVGTSMFIAIAAVAATESPIASPNKWLSLVSTSKFSTTYTNQTSVEITHGIQNAVCDVRITATGKNAGVSITKSASNKFLIESNQALSCTVLIY